MTLALPGGLKVSWGTDAIRSSHAQLSCDAKENPMVRRAHRWLPLILVAALAACDNGSTEPTGPEGRYNLVSINGMSLPFTLYDDGTYVDVLVSAWVQVNSDGTCSESFTYQFTEPGGTTTETQTDTCTWTATGTAITISYPGGFTIAGALSGNTMTVTVSDGSDTFVLVFSK